MSRLALGDNRGFVRYALYRTDLFVHIICYSEFAIHLFYVSSFYRDKLVTTVYCVVFGPSCVCVCVDSLCMHLDKHLNIENALMLGTNLSLSIDFSKKVYNKLTIVCRCAALVNPNLPKRGGVG